MTLQSWLVRFFQGQYNGRGEFILQCPKCSKPKLYFNIKKRIGFCHYASCPYHISPPSLRDLAVLVGSVPTETASYVEEEPEPLDSTPVEISLPEGTQPLVFLQGGEYVTNAPQAVAAVRKRGVSVEDQFHFRFHFGNHYVYIPVYLDGTMVSYLGRRAWWYECEGKRYDNAHGTHTNRYLFNWDEAKNYHRLTLVENTFNAIAYRNDIQSTSTFGSALSDHQIKRIAESTAETVAFLWDEEAEIPADKAIQKLKNTYGIPAAAGWFRGQPDDYSLEWVIDAAEKVHAAARENTNMVRL